MNATCYGPAWSSNWDEYFGASPDTDEAVEHLAELAAGRPILEYGIGTGRLALPLQKRGLRIHGVDNSSSMVEKLRQKAGGDTLPITIGDFATIEVPGRFGLVFVANNTFFALASQELQIQCFQNAKKHLDIGGLFLLQVPSLHNLPAEDGKYYAVNVDANGVILKARQVDLLTQECYQCVVILRNGEPPRVQPSAFRYSSPGELDLMARIAGMQLRSRWGGWDRRPVTPHDFLHISVYESIP